MAGTSDSAAELPPCGNICVRGSSMSCISPSSRFCSELGRAFLPESICRSLVIKYPAILRPPAPNEAGTADRRGGEPCS